ncbi:MAG: M67 family metallopeptidase [Treponema sp.]|nr:M67 family metallopeptidase [Treponema sp.]
MILLAVEAEQRIRAEGEKAYPNECCGFLFGSYAGSERRADTILTVENAREEGERYHRFVITPEDFMRAEKEALRLNREIFGIYHSHPDHPARPSDYDREHALPFYSYLIVGVEAGKALALTSWELTSDRNQFLEEEINLWR